MTFTDNALLYQAEIATEQRLRKCLPPGPAPAQQLRQFKAEFRRAQLTIGFNPLL